MTDITLAARIGKGWKDANKMPNTSLLYLSVSPFILNPLHVTPPFFSLSYNWIGGVIYQTPYIQVFFDEPLHNMLVLRSRTVDSVQRLCLF